ncbi:MAG: nucleotide pyrophosphohydrolase [Burkholderiaceae bacterium]|nr:nucleotide pyrophosphohydrolase [Burkholderiaceae bacterium]
MDIADLQFRLRQFARARQWEPYQTPKNLAMAMMVEAAELLEIFQWMTPEASMQVASEPAVHQHLGEEIADVMLYLVQIADHSGIDLQAAVERKLQLNALKYPVTAKPGTTGEVA